MIPGLRGYSSSLIRSTEFKSSRAVPDAERTPEIKQATPAKLRRPFPMGGLLGDEKFYC